MRLSIDIKNAISEVDSASWDAIAGDMPLLSHAFLSALEASGSVGDGTGWQPSHLLVLNESQLVGAMPLYLKNHSYGEYVFDWAWAEAYARNGLPYYPKLVSAIPFTPITSARLLSRNREVQELMIKALQQIMHKHQLSSAHVLFPNDESAQAYSRAGWLKRVGVQFRWENESFSDFDDFLNTLSHDKRKKIRQERKKIVLSGVTCRQVKGDSITPEQWEFFYHCYENTYFQHRSTPYLTLSFFQQIGRTMPQNILMVLAYADDEPIAAALNLYDKAALYGRYWGAMQYVPNLHFELCYYQAQEFCIAENILYFEGGAQGEHKLARGFKPRPTCSYHKIAHEDFARAIEDFVHQESQGMAVYTSELEERAPFRAVME